MQTQLSELKGMGGRAGPFVRGVNVPPCGRWNCLHWTGAGREAPLVRTVLRAFVSWEWGGPLCVGSLEERNFNGSLDSEQFSRVLPD